MAPHLHSVPTGPDRTTQPVTRLGDLSPRRRNALLTDISDHLRAHLRQRGTTTRIGPLLAETSARFNCAEDIVARALGHIDALVVPLPSSPEAPRQRR